MSFLVTGAASGLGKAIADNFGGTQITRGEFAAFRRGYRGGPFDAIFHCAFNSSKDVTISTADKYVYDNLFFTQELVELECKKFIYISSQDVYPRSLRVRREDADFDLTAIHGVYPFTKIFSELAIQRRVKNFLICRPTTFLGRSMRPNTTSRLLVERHPKLFLAPDSRFNYVHHGDVVRFLEIALQRDLTGVYNIASCGTVTLREICGDLGLAPTFGDFLYDIGNVVNTKAAAHYPRFARTSDEALNEFIDQLGAAFVGSGRVGKGVR